MDREQGEKLIEVKNAKHVVDLDLTDASDRKIRLEAKRTGAVIVSKDSDFVTQATLDEEGPPLVWIRLGNARRQALLEWFTPVFPKILAALEQGEKLIEIEQHSPPCSGCMSR